MVVQIRLQEGSVVYREDGGINLHRNIDVSYKCCYGMLTAVRYIGSELFCGTKVATAYHSCTNY